jgi:hypothetical protein
MLSLGKYQTFQVSSNISHIPRAYAQNFLAYSPLDHLLIFIEPKYQISVYDAQSIRHIVSLPINTVPIGTSTRSLVTNDHYDLYFIYESQLEFNSIALRVCQVRFDMIALDFHNKTCIESFNLSHNESNFRINGFSIKRDHAGTSKSLLFLSTNIGLVYMIFDTRSGAIVRLPAVMNDTSNEGSIVVSSSGSIYYANKKEHIIHELIVARDFRIRYGKIIKSNAIKYPYGLTTDECNHL